MKQSKTRWKAIGVGTKSGGGETCVTGDVGMGVGVDVEVAAPLDHALEDGDEALEALEAQRLLLGRRGAVVGRVAALRDLRQHVDQPLEDVGRRQVAVVVDVQVHHRLRVRADPRQRLPDETKAKEC